MLGRWVCWFCGLALVLVVAVAGAASAQTTADADKLDAEVIRLYQAGKYAEAIPLAQQVLAIREKALGPEHPDVGTSLNNLAGLYRAQGRFAEAEPLSKRSLALREKALGPEHPDVGTSLNNLAELYRAQGRFAEAEPLYKRSLALREKALGPEHPDVGRSLNSLALLYESQGRFAEAEPLYKHSITILEKALGPEHPDVGQSLNNLAALYESQGRFAEAEPLYKRSLALREKAQGPEHPHVGSSLNNLAGLYKSQGRFAEAEPLYKRSLALHEKALGPEHPEVGTSLNNLASLYESQGRFAEAEPLYKRSLALREKALGPEHPSVGASLNNLAGLYEAQGRFAEAEPLYKRSLALHEKALGPEHPSVGTLLNNLAGLYKSQGRFAEAEPLYKRSLALREKALGPEHPHVGASLNNLASLYESQGRFAEAEPLYKRTITILEKALGPEHPLVGTSLNNLAGLYRAQGRLAEAEPLYKRSLALREKALGPEHPDVGMSLNNLAELYRAQGRFAEAEPLYKRSLALREKALGPEHPDVGTSLNNLAGLYKSQGRFAEAEPLFKRSLALREKALGPEHPDVGTSLNNLAELYESQGRFAEAEPLNKRSLALYEKALGPEHPWVGTSLNNLAALYKSQGRFAEAEPLYKRSLANSEKALGPEHPDVGTSLNNLAGLYESQGRFAEAEPLFKRSLALREKALGPEHPDVGTSLNSLAWFSLAQGDLAAASSHWQLATALLQRRAERGLGGASGGSSKGEAQRSSWYFEGLVKTTQRLATAEMFETAQWAQSSEAASSLAQMAARSAGGSAELAALVRERQDLVAEWQAVDKRLITAKSEPPGKRNVEAETALADRLAAIDARLAEIDAVLGKNFPDYATVASPRPISVADVQGALADDEALVLFLDTVEFKPLPEETFVWVVTKSDVRWVRADLGTAALAREVAALRCGLDATAWYGEGSKRCADLLKLSPGQVPKGGQPLPFDAARAHALYKALFAGAEDLIRGKHLIVVPSGALTKLPFQVLVTQLPDGVDAGARSRKVARMGVEFRPPTPEDRAGSTLLDGQGAFVVRAVPGGPAEAAGVLVGDIIVSVAGKTVERERTLAEIVQLEVPGETVEVTLVRNGKTTSLSLMLGEATITDWRPYFLDNDAARKLRWLVRDHATTVLPSVAALKSLRRVGKPSRADREMIGFGNPLLDGADERDAAQARAARAIQKCRETVVERVASLIGLRGGVAPVATRGGLADIGHLKRQAPLPETADELCAVARDLGADVRELRLGARATESEIKRLDASGDLARYRIVHFATHGTLAGQLTGTSEPGLILTPPDTATENDDGYLSGGEIASMKLDADWVILSACNTAGGDDAVNAEALAGLARVFFYAGARALLVSHWEVYSDATVKLITGAVRSIADGSVGRAEALRRGMLDLIDNGAPHEAHPAYWAPFVVVGEGGAGR